VKFRLTRRWLELANQWLDSSCDSTRNNFRWLWLEGLVTLTRQKWLGHTTAAQ